MIYILMSELNHFRCVESVFDDERKAISVMCQCKRLEQNQDREWFIQTTSLNRICKPNHIPAGVSSTI